MPRMIIVVGSESSGTRLCQEILTKATGFRGDDKDTEEWWWATYHGEHLTSLQVYLPAAGDRVTRRSIPHGPMGGRRYFPNVALFIKAMAYHGFQVSVAMTVRDRNACALSKVRVHTKGDYFTAGKEVCMAEISLGNLMQFPVPVTIWSYECIMALGLPYVVERLNEMEINVSVRTFDTSKLPDLVDGNVKYLKDDPWQRMEDASR